MEKELINEIGKKYGKLEVLEVYKRDVPRKMIVAYCKCECSVRKEIELTSLRSGRSKSCGCNFRTQGGGTYTYFYRIWSRIKRYRIELSKDWQDYLIFETWCRENRVKQNHVLYPENEEKPLGEDNVVIQEVDPRRADTNKIYAYFLYSPNGEEYFTDDLFDFCFTHGLNPHIISSMCTYREKLDIGNKKNKPVKSHLGWTAERFLLEDVDDYFTYEDTLFYPYTPIL